MSRVFAVLVLLVPTHARVALRSRVLNQPPPEPVGTMPETAADGAFGSQSDACAACKYSATGSCAMYKSCVCHATNAHFPVVNVPEPTDQDNWHWSCDGEGGDKFSLCFKVDYTYQDSFGDDVD